MWKLRRGENLRALWRHALRRRIWAGIIAAFVISAGVVGAALSLPRLVDEKNQSVTLVGNLEFTELSGSDSEGITASTAGWSVSLNEFTRLEEPDVLDEWIEYRRFVGLVGDLNERATTGTYLELIRPDHSVLRVQVQRGSLALLGWAFWFQMVTALFCVTTGELTYHLSRPSPGLLGYRLAGWGVAFAAWASALYATRSVGLSVELLEAAHAVNSVLGGPLFGAGVCMLLASEPVRLFKRTWLFLIGVAFTALAWHARFAEFGPALSGYSAILAYTGGIVALLVWQRFVLRTAVEHAIWRWLTLGVVSGIVFFVLAQALPIAFGMRPLASQTMTLVGFAWLFGLLSLGASRYRLFSVARYWGRTWKWLSISAGLIGLDLAVAASLPGTWGAHGWVLLLGGAWLYFPVRQLLLERLNGKSRSALLEGARNLSNCSTEVDLLHRFEQELGRLFDTADIQVGEASPEVYLTRDGQDLVVPWPRGDATFVFRHKKAGRALFHQGDVEEARAHLDFARNLLEARDAYSRGEADERQRVRRDLHDHLGARLSRLAVLSGEEKVMHEISALTRELRQLTAALTGERMSLESVLMELESEARAQARVHGLPIQIRLSSDQEVTRYLIEPRQRSDFLAFVRESLENAGRHGARSGEVQMEMTRKNGGLSLKMMSHYDEKTHHAPRLGGLGLGTGILNLRRRAQLGGGQFVAEIQDAYFVTSWWSPLPIAEQTSVRSSSVRRIAADSHADKSRWKVAR